MSRRWMVTAAAILAIELAVFYTWNQDLVALSRSAETLAVDPAFGHIASATLSRPRVSRRVLERIVEVAERRRDYPLQVTALERIAAAAPGDTAVQVRLADALRSQGRLTEAEAIYGAVLARSTQGGRP